MQAKSTRDDQILAKQLGQLFAGSYSSLANLVVGGVVAYMLRGTYPSAALFAWIAAMALVIAGRIGLKVWFDGTPQKCNICWIWRFTAGAFASGLLWAALCVGLLIWGDAREFLLLTLVTAGMTAGALTTVIAFFPAYLAYSAPITITMAFVSLASPDRYISANGMMVLVYFAVVALAARNGSRAVNRGIALHVDLEEASRSLETARVERDKARSEKWTTLSQLSHELRTPLNAILGFSEAIAGEYFGPLGNSRYKEYVEHVHTSGQHLMRLVDELLELGRGESGKLEMREAPVELDMLLASCLDMMRADAAHLTLKRHLAPSLPLIKADKTKLRQMVLHLLGNAIKFTPEGGEVTLSGYPAPGGGIAVVVQDSGIGMSAEEIEVAIQPFGRLVNPFNDAKPGMGLGLPMVKRLAELHGAELTIASEPGYGTTCTLWFPAERVLGESAAPDGATCASSFAA